MPGYRGKRRFSRRFKKRSRTSWYNKKYSAYDVARYAWKGVKYLKGLVNAEMYRYDQAVTAQSVASDSTYALNLVPIANGDGDGARTGNSIFVRHIRIDGDALYNSSATTSGQVINFALVLDTQQIGDTSPAWSDVFADAYPWSHIKSTTAGRFTILRRFSLTLPKNGATIKNFKIHKTMRHHVRFNGTAGTDIQKGGLYLMAISDTLLASNPPTVNFRARVSYHDN